MSLGNIHTGRLPAFGSNARAALLGVLVEAGLDPMRISAGDFDEFGYDELLFDRNGRLIVDPASNLVERRRRTWPLGLWEKIEKHLVSPKAGETAQ